MLPPRGAPLELGPLPACAAFSIGVTASSAASWPRPAHPPTSLSTVAHGPRTLTADRAATWPPQPTTRIVADEARHVVELLTESSIAVERLRAGTGPGP